MSKEFSILTVVMLLCTGAIIGVQFLAGSSAPDGEVYRSVATDLYNRRLFDEAIAYYDRYLDSAQLEPVKAANIHYEIGKISQDDLKDHKAALARYILVRKLAPDSGVARQANTRMVECLERLERSLDAANLLRESTALKDQPTPPPGQVIATIGDRAITISDYEEELAKLPPAYRQQLSGPAQQLELLQQLVGREVLKQAASRKGLHDDPEVERRLEELRADVMVQALVEQEMEKEANPSENEVKLFYEARQSEYKAPRMVEIGHIQLANRAEAELVLSELRGGADFAAKAKEHSQDSATAGNGGYLGFVTQEGPVPQLGQYPAINQAAFDVKPGNVSYIVETDLGFHLLNIISERTEEVMPFQQIKSQVRADLVAERTRQAQETMFQRYMEAEDVEIKQETFLRLLGASQ